MRINRLASHVSGIVRQPCSLHLLQSLALQKWSSASTICNPLIVQKTIQNDSLPNWHARWYYHHARLPKELQFVEGSLDHFNPTCPILDRWSTPLNVDLSIAMSIISQCRNRSISDMKTDRDYKNYQLRTKAGVTRYMVHY